MTTQCAWGSLQVEGAGWLNATVAVQSGGQALTLTAQLPSGMSSAAGASVLGSAYGWGPIPMMSAVDKASDLPVLPWNRSVAASLSYE